MIIWEAVSNISKEQMNTATVNPDSWLRHPGVLLTKGKKKMGGGGVGCYQKSFRCVVHTMPIGWMQTFMTHRVKEITSPTRIIKATACKRTVLAAKY
jgi:hypothetical protein